MVEIVKILSNYISSSVHTRLSSMPNNTCIQDQVHYLDTKLVILTGCKKILGHVKIAYWDSGSEYDLYFIEVYSYLSSGGRYSIKAVVGMPSGLILYTPQEVFSNVPVLI